MWKVMLNNREMEVEENASLLSLAKKVQGEYAHDILLASVNGKLAELHKTVTDGSMVSFFTAADKPGIQTYHRSMIFLLVKAIYKVAGREDLDKVAVLRGPITYCLEEADNGPDLHLCQVYAGRTGEAQAMPVEIGGREMRSLKLPGAREERTDGPLYQDYVPAKTRPVTLHFIPYFAWANRGEGEMRVWVDTMQA